MKLFALVFAVCCSTGQGQSNLSLVSGPPPAVSGAGAVWTGRPGNAPIYYWIAVRYHAGWVLPTKPTVVGNTLGIDALGGGNSVRLQWDAAPGATGYDVFRMSSPNYLGSCAGCAVALNISATSYTDSSPFPGTNYPPTGFTLASAVSGVGYIDQLSDAAPFVNWTMLGRSLRWGLVSSYTVGNCVQFGLSGSLVVLTDAGSPCGTGSGAVISVFGRTGPVTAHTGDYSAGQISGLGALATAGYPGTGLVYSNGSAFSPAVPGVDYASSFDNPAWSICTTLGCQPEVTFSNYFISSPAGFTWLECGFALQSAPTVQAVIADVQTSGGVSVLGATKLVVLPGSSATVFQSVFASSPQTAAKGDQFRAVIVQGDTGGTALGGFLRCRGK
jgi:hypothetical protein